SRTRISSPEVISSMRRANMVLPVSTSETPAVVIGLGANLGEPLAQLRSAVLALSALSLAPVKVAPLYRSAPVGPEQPGVLNSALLLSWQGTLRDLLGATSRIEQRFGRQRNLHWGPRTLDLDLLWAGDQRVSCAVLTVPHPELRRRSFALSPLLDLVPDARDPESDKPYALDLADVRWQRIERVRGPDWVSDTF